MEYIDGEDLASLLRRIGRLPQDKAMEFTRKICAGLAAAHDRGVLHRDLKPANIMIDGRGQPRITDFGLAGLAAEIPLSDLRSGTPAYMSPEQKSGKEVTTRSDIYSLGLVLHEMFTGKQRAAGSSTSPSDFVKELDPAIERLILRCLEEDPKRRPSAAFNVAMALPGADPIAAALAAGETPSPEMVAASQEKEGFSARTALLCFAGLLVALGVAIAVHSRISMPVQAPLKLAPEAMADRVQQFLQSIGDVEDDTSKEYGYVCCLMDETVYVASLKPEEQKAALSTHRPAIARFYYRQQRNVPASPPDTREFPDDETTTESRIRVLFDANAHLLRLEVGPGLTLPQTATPDSAKLFTAAGLDFGRFTPVVPDPNVSVPLDTQFAWVGDFGVGHKEKVRVEAGFRGGHPALFWVKPEIPTDRRAARDTIPLGVVLLVPLLSLILAVRNLRQGRADRKGGYVILTLATVFSLGAAMLNSGHDGGQSFAPPLVLVCWLMYLATEPFVRRYWPDALISWSRVCSGKIRNGLVASHVLAGVTVAEVFGGFVFRVAERIDGSPLGMLGVHARGIADLGSAATTIGGGFSYAMGGMLYGLLFVLLVTLLRLAIRKMWVADGLASVLQAFLVLYGYPYGVVLYGVSIVTWLGDMWLLRRFGFFAFLVGWIAQTMVVQVPLVTTGWLASQSLMIHLVPVMLGSWALWVILTDKRAGGVSTETAA
jgi:serine/threonine-protein kinase